MDTLAEVLHHLVDNCSGFVATEARKAHELITDELGGDRHSSVPDPENPDAGNQAEDTDNTPDSRDAEIARLRAELDRRSQGPGPADNASASVTAPSVATSGAEAPAPVPAAPAPGTATPEANPAE